MTPEEIRQIIREELKDLIKTERYTFQKHLQLFDGRNITVGRNVGTKFGTATDQKASFYNATPVVQGSTISDPSGQANDLDSESRTAINALIDRLQDFGIIA